MQSPIRDTFQFGTKAETLARLGTIPSRNFCLCPQFLIARPCWMADRPGVTTDALEALGGSLLAVRSSAANEDGWDQSLAGANLSLMNVAGTPREIGNAIDRVFDSYEQPDDGDQVLVQSMITGVAVSGVVLSRDLDTGSPYFVVNYDDASGRTDTVTGGADSHTLLIYRGHPQSIHSSRFRQLIDSVIEIETLTGSRELDVEFCITSDETVYILQVRPLAARQNWQVVSDQLVDQVINRIYTEIENRITPPSGVVGQSVILGEMPDWNPAEMIGTTPRPLALSLYKRLITDHVWAEARSAMGYRLVPHPLLIDFHGRPYIDVRLSLNSFLPDGLDDALAERLIDRQLALLEDRRDLHDKIEFEIAATCRDFSFTDQRSWLGDGKLGSSDLKDFEYHLSELTANALDQRGDGISHLLEKSRQLLNARPEDRPSLDRVSSLLDECMTKGTLPFSMLARHAFIGISFLKSLVTRGAFSPYDHDRFMRSIHTIASDFVIDMARLETGDMDQDTFLEQYGHLRPGTYDILSFRYDSRPDLYLGNGGHVGDMPNEHFELEGPQEKAIHLLLDEVGYELSPSELLDYTRQAVAAREDAKFAFTRNISDALQMLVLWGQEHGFSREDLSFLPINVLLEEADHGILRARIEKERERYVLTRAIRLPHLISEPDDVHVVRLPLGRPTFITSQNVTAQSVDLGLPEAGDVDGRIVLIESADPGFDWIFTHSIKGLITCYGGTNSHMAIRCAEFGLPAAIGCGERLFQNLTQVAIIELNCAERKISGH